MKHTCHHPGCTKEVPPSMWGCRPHWFRLPKRLRAMVWATYRPGQEIDKQPSASYLQVADEVQRWCLQNPEIKRVKLKVRSVSRMEPPDFSAQEAGA